jgi:hypothetical protein
MVVGSYLDASNATGVNGTETDTSSALSGAAFVYVYNGRAWVQQAYLKASNSAPNTEFGKSVSISGNTIVVGAWGEASSATGVNGNQSDTSAPTAGAAYVFVRNGAIWTQQAYIKASDTTVGAWFGTSVSLSGDTMVIGAPGYQAPSGKAYVFVRNGTAWTQQALLTSSTPASGDNFGASVSLSAGTIAVGASGDKGTGAAYIFVQNATAWGQQSRLSQSGQGFGGLVALDQDTLAVLTPNAFFPETIAVFARSGVNWSAQAPSVYVPPNGCSIVGASCSLSSMALKGNILAVGTQASIPNYVTNAGTITGVVLLLERSGTTWTTQTGPGAPGGNNNFAVSLALSGDGSTLAAGDTGYTPIGYNGYAAVGNEASVFSLNGVGKSLSLQGPPSGFGLVPVGTTMQGTVQITNVGAETVTITTGSIAGGNPGEFTLASYQCTGAGFVLVPGDNCQAVINFTPSIAYYRTAVLTILDDAHGSPHELLLSGIGTSGPLPQAVSPAAVDFGVAPLGFLVSSNVTLNNYGNGMVTLQQATIAGPNAADFAINSNPCTTLGPGQHCSMSLQFTASQLGWETAFLVQPNDSPYGTIIVPLYAVGK